MKLAGSRLLLVAAVAGLMTAAASPAFAWVCTAKNIRGALYTATGTYELGTCAVAMARCQADSRLPRTCHVVGSHS